MPDWLSGWQYRKKITIDETKIDDDLTDFPVLVKLTSSNFDFSKARSDGFDVRFCSSDGTTLLKYERERHDATNQVAEYWVKIPSVSSSADTDFYIYYGNAPASDGADPTNVWDSNFIGVWHSKDATSYEINDSTSNANLGTKMFTNEPIEADAKIGKGQDYDGVNDAIGIADNASIDINYITIEAWINLDKIGAEQKIVIRDGVGTGDRMWQFSVWGAANKLDVLIWNTGDTIGEAISTTVFITATDYYVVGTFDGSNVKAYVNGVLEGSGALSGTIKTGNEPIFFGGGKTNSSDTIPTGFWLDGRIDEVRISNIARSAAWLKASYNSGNNSLVSYGSEKSYGSEEKIWEYSSRNITSWNYQNKNK